MVRARYDRASTVRALASASLLALAAASCSRAESRTRGPEGPALPSPAAVLTPLPAASAASATEPRARFVGRWVPEPSGSGMRCAWSGSYVVGRFEGTSVTARIMDEGHNLFEVVVDGAQKRVLRTDRAKGEASYVLAEDLPAGVHDVSLHRRAEAKVGEAVFYGFEAPGGRVLPPPPAPARRIEIIGDSISTGYGNEGPGERCGYVNSQQNEYVTYGAIAARSVGADHTTIAWSGKTLYEMRQYLDKALPQRGDGPLWDFSRYQPQVVVINVGTNNFARVDPGEAKFVRLYHELVHAVRAAYPSALVVCALGTMLSDVYPEGRRNLTKARQYMKAAVARLKEVGDGNVTFIEFPEQKHSDGLGCGYHPGKKTHEQMGRQLTAFLKERMGW